LLQILKNYLSGKEFVPAVMFFNTYFFSFNLSDNAFPSRQTGIYAIACPGGAAFIRRRERFGA